jgi:hypothetical protein
LRHQSENFKSNVDRTLNISNVSISFPYINKGDVSLQIEGGEVQLDHPSGWGGDGDSAEPSIIINLVVAGEVGRLDNSGSRRCRVAAHISAGFWRPPMDLVWQICDTIEREKFRFI